MSNTQNPYLLDTNVFIEAAKHYYAFDLAPSFWEELVSNAKKGCILSIDKVKAELDEKEDRPKQWTNDDFVQWFEPVYATDVLGEYDKIMKWVEESDFVDKAKKDFADYNKADAWIVAYAKAKGCVVVTHEKYRPGRKHKIQIPNACEIFGVRSVDTFQMLRELGIQL